MGFEDGRTVTCAMQTHHDGLIGLLKSYLLNTVPLVSYAAHLSYSFEYFNIFYLNNFLSSASYEFGDKQVRSLL